MNLVHFIEVHIITMVKLIIDYSEKHNIILIVNDRNSNDAYVLLS